MAMILGLSALAMAQDGSLRGTVTVLHHSKKISGNADVVVSLTSLDAKASPVAPGPKVRLVQKNKQFTPHLVAVPVGTAIEFPNQDPFFHDVFSIYHGKPFDLGLYEGGAVRSVRFSQPGVSYIFCNIHPEMSAAVVALTTPYFATSAADGKFEVGHLPAGQYKMEVWYEFASESELAGLSRKIEVRPGSNDPIVISVHSSDGAHTHVNKYGEPYPQENVSTY
jgi:plastocyanin